MKKILERILTDIRKYRVACIAFIVYWTSANLIFHAYCPLRLLTGIPCPGCGLTRAGAAVLLLHFRDAWEYHPLIFLVFPALLAAMVFRYVLGRKMPYGKGLLIVILAALLLVYPFRMKQRFPDDHGLYLYENNLASHFIEGWNDRLADGFGQK